MNTIRFVKHDLPGCCCSRCGQGPRAWDRVAGKPICAGCQEALAFGDGEPLIERPQPVPCVICEKRGSLCFHTVPQEAQLAIEFDLCGLHLAALLSRRLTQPAFLQLQRRLRAAGVQVEQIFLLHDAFYDLNGRAIEPTHEPEW